MHERIPKHLFTLRAVHSISQVVEKLNLFLCILFFLPLHKLVSPYTKNASLIPRLSVSNHMWIPCKEYYPVATIAHMHKLFRDPFRSQWRAELVTNYKVSKGTWWACVNGFIWARMSLCEWFHLSKDPHLADLWLHTLHEPAHGSRLY